MPELYKNNLIPEETLDEILDEIQTKSQQMVTDGRRIINAAIDNPEITKGALLDALTLGDDTKRSGTLTLKHAAGGGDTFIKAGTIDDGDFSNAGGNAGFIMGIDDSDSDKVKFFFGGASEYIQWDGSTLTIEGGVTVDELHIPDQDTTANSFHVNTNGDAWWGATESDFNTDNDNAAAYVLKDGTAKFKSNTTLEDATIVDNFTALTPITAGRAVMIRDDSKVIHCNADLSDMTDAFLGFAIDSAAADANVRVRLSGKTSALSGLTTSSIYYVQDVTNSSAETITQDQEDSTFNGLGGGAITQTFTATRNLLESIIWKVQISTSNSTYLVEIKDSGDNVVGSETETINNTGGFAERTITFSPKLLLTKGEVYTIRITHDSGSNDGEWRYNSSDVYAGGSFSEGGDMYFKVNEIFTDGKIGTSAGSNSRKVGLAVDTDSLLILND